MTEAKQTMISLSQDRILATINSDLESIRSSFDSPINKRNLPMLPVKLFELYFKDFFLGKITNEVIVDRLHQQWGMIGVNITDSQGDQVSFNAGSTNPVIIIKEDNKSGSITELFTIPPLFSTSGVHVNTFKGQNALLEIFGNIDNHLNHQLPALVTQGVEREYNTILTNIIIDSPYKEWLGFIKYYINDFIEIYAKDPMINELEKQTAIFKNGINESDFDDIDFNAD